MSRICALLDLVFVPHCPACDRRVPAGVALCDACSLSLVELGAACPRCAEPLEGPTSVPCRRCRTRPLPLARIDAPLRYGGQLAVALRRLKYTRRPEVARALAPLLAPALTRAASDCDLAIPVPLHWRRHAARGFNQAAALVRHAGAELAVPIDTLSLRRSRATRPQSGLDGRARTANVAGAFTVPARRRRRVEGRRVLLVDDVVTTAATVAAAARTLLDAGAASVRAFAAARAET